MGSRKKQEETRRAVNRINVAGRLTLWGADDLRNLLLSEIESAQELEIELAPKDEIDISGVQILLAAKLEAENRSQALRVPAEVPESISQWLDRAAIPVDSLRLPREGA